MFTLVGSNDSFEFILHNILCYFLASLVYFYFNTCRTRCQLLILDVLVFYISLRIEVADFDFEEEEAPEMSFFERLQSSIFQYWSAMKSRQSEVNSALLYKDVTFD